MAASHYAGHAAFIHGMNGIEALLNNGAFLMLPKRTDLLQSCKRLNCAGAKCGQQHHQEEPERGHLPGRGSHNALHEHTRTIGPGRPQSYRIHTVQYIQTYHSTQGIHSKPYGRDQGILLERQCDNIQFLIVI